MRAQADETQAPASPAETAQLALPSPLCVQLSEINVSWQRGTLMRTCRHIQGSIRNTRSHTVTLSTSSHGSKQPN